ncbi:hypothetical protein VP01_149g1 [Puccinia sorghi]|uniref:Integrase catalytic domain-containing protein n=1 Tax=Puccinia sorghi TaxID=27349 RepID=A0A0L6VJP9_9BASI|nr:hypothetical protein VP01_149g1 [Puccinia sorghi]
MVSDINLFISLDLKEQGIVRTSSGHDSLEIKGIGTIKLSNEFGNIFLNRVLYVPNLVINLLSVRALVLEDFNVQFLKNSFSLSRNNQIVMSGRYEGNLPCLNFFNLEEKSFLSTSEQLHKSLGHVSYHRIRQKLGIPLRNIVSCEACALSKITRASFKSKHKKASRPFEELHLDLIGPISPSSRNGDRYILTVVDSHTRYCSATPLTLKSDVFETLTTIIDFEAKRFGYYPSILHSDRGGEFINSSMEAYCKEHLIKSRTSDPYTPQQNGLAERHNRTIVESLRTILTDSDLSKKYWSDVVKLFKGRSIPIDFFRPIGNPVSFLIQPKKPGSKIYPKGSRGRLIGYNEDLLSYRVLAEDGSIVETKNIQFLDFIPEKPSSSDDFDCFEIINENIHEPTPPMNEREDVEAALDDRIEIKEEEPDRDIHNEQLEVISVISEDNDDEIAELLVPSSSGRVLRERTSRIKPVKYSHLTGCR